METQETERSTLGLARDAASDVVELVKQELALARRELRDEVAAIRGPAAAMAFGSALAIVGAQLWLASFAVRRPRLGGVLGLGLLGAGAALASTGWRAMPRRVLEDTRARVKADAQLAKEVLP